MRDPPKLFFDGAPTIAVGGRTLLLVGEGANKNKLSPLIGGRPKNIWASGNVENHGVIFLSRYTRNMFPRESF